MRLIRQLLTESILLALLGGVFGAVLGIVVCRALEGLRPLGDFPVRFGFTFDWRVFGYVAAAAGLSGILAGLAPALRLSRTSLNDALREGGRGAAGDARRHTLRNTLVIAQVAGSLILLVAAGLFTRSLKNTESVNLGFDAHNLLNVGLDPGLQGYDRPRAEAFFRELLRRTKALPGVESASLAYSVPCSYYNQGASVYPEGQEASSSNRAPGAGYNLVSPEYFTTMRLPVIEGRAFTDADIDSSQQVAIVNETMARRLWPNENALGRRFSYKAAAGPFVIVVGIARSARVQDIVEEPGMYFYVPRAQEYNATSMLQIRTSVQPESLAPSVEAEVRDLDPGMPVYDVMSMEHSLDGGNGFFIYKMGAAFAGTLGGLGLVLAVVGLYGVVSYSTSRRTHELGVRMALGARSGGIFGLVLRQAVLPVSAGIGVGLLAALGVTRFLSSLLVGVTSYDPVTFCAVSLLLVLVALAACMLPALRAMRVDPVVALRHD